MLNRSGRFSQHAVNGLLWAAVLAGIVYLFAAPKPWALQLPSASKLRPEHYAMIYCWWAALINLVPLAALALTVRWWVRPIELPPSGPVRPSRSKAFWITVIAAMAICAGVNFPRLSYGFWDDEEYSVRRAVLGAYKQNDDGDVKLRKVPWSTTLWYYGKPTNHILQSVLSRVSNSTWRAIAKPKGLQFSETAVRLPSYLAGIATIALIASLLARMGFERAGALAALILALHPWYMRFVPEARGYALVFFFAAINWHCLLGMTRSGRWGWWIGFAVSEFCMIYTWPGAIPLVLLTNGLLVGWILSDRPLAGALAWRWGAVSALVSVALFQLLLPCVPQFAAYLKDCVRMPMEWYWLRNVGSLLVTGSHWTKTGRLDSPYPEFFPVANSHPVLAVALLVAVLIFLGWGVVWLVRGREPALKIFAGLWLLTGPVTFLIAKLKGEYLFEWYMAYAVPGLVCLAAVGMNRVAEFKMPRLAAVGFLAMLVALYAIVTHNQRAFLVSRPVQFIKESVLLTRATLDPHTKENRMVLTVATIASPEIYDPQVRRAPSVHTLSEFLIEADEKKLPLFINQGYPSALKAEFPATYAMVNDPELFEKIGEFTAVEEMLDRVVYRYKPGSIAGKDIRSYGENPPLNRAFIY